MKDSNYDIADSLTQEEYEIYVDKLFAPLLEKK